MKTIQFTRTERYESEGRNLGPLYEKDSVHNFEDAFADRWLRRFVAIDITGMKLPVIAEGDGLDGLKLPELKRLAEDEGLKIPANTKKDDIVAAIRAGREPKSAVVFEPEGDGLDDLDDDALLAKAEEAGLSEDQCADRDTILAALRTPQA